MAFGLFSNYIGSYNNNAYARTNSAFGNFLGSAPKSSQYQGLSSAISNSSTQIVKNTSNSLIEKIKGIGDFAKGLDSTVKNVSNATKGLMQTAEEAKSGIGSTIGKWHKKKTESHKNLSPDLQKLSTQKRRLEIQGKQTELKYNQYIANIKVQMKQLQENKERELDSLNTQIIRSNNDLQREQLKLRKQQLEFQYDQRLLDYESRLDELDNAKENEMQKYKVQIAVVNNEISTVSKKEMKQSEADMLRKQLVAERNLESLSKEQITAQAKQAREKLKQQESLKNTDVVQKQRLGNPQQTLKTLQQLNMRPNLSNAKRAELIRQQQRQGVSPKA